MNDDRWLEHLAGKADAGADAGGAAPARLKARIYSALVQAQSEAGPLLSLRATKEAGHPLCVFEDTVASLPLGEGIGSRNPCRVCHARILGERLERAPIFWPHCPYAEFHRR